MSSCLNIILETLWPVDTCIYISMFLAILNQLFSALFCYKTVHPALGDRDVIYCIEGCVRIPYHA